MLGVNCIFLLIRRTNLKNNCINLLLIPSKLTFMFIFVLLMWRFVSELFSLASILTILPSFKLLAMLAIILTCIIPCRLTNFCTTIILLKIIKHGCILLIHCKPILFILLALPSSRSLFREASFTRLLMFERHLLDLCLTLIPIHLLYTQNLLLCALFQLNNTHVVGPARVTKFQCPTFLTLIGALITLLILLISTILQLMLLCHAVDSVGAWNRREDFLEEGECLVFWVHFYIS